MLFIIEMTPILYTYDSLKKTREIINKRKEAGDIPPDYKKNFLEKLIYQWANWIFCFGRPRLVKFLSNL